MHYAMQKPALSSRKTTASLENLVDWQLDKLTIKFFVYPWSQIMWA